MASQLRFEGPVLEDLLDRVRSEVGPGARVIAANRVRKGGVGGFFAREHYEVVVEKPDQAFALALDDDVPSIAVATASAPAPAPVAPTRKRGGTKRAPEAKSVGPGRARVPTSILDLAEAMNDIERDNDMIDLLDDDDEQRLTPAVSDRPGPGSGLDDPAPGFGGPVPGSGVPVPTPNDAFAAVLERITRVADHAARNAEEDDALFNEARQPALVATVKEQLETATKTARRSATAARVVEDTPVEAPREDARVIAEAPVPAVFRRVARTDDVIERPENALARLGVPARLVPRGAGAREMQGALIESLSRLPVPTLLPDAPGVVVAVVGLGARPVLLARELAEELAMDPDRVVLATREPLGEGVPAWLQVCDATTAEERRRSWRRRPYATLVACSLPSGPDALAWARDILDHLEPTSTWAIVDAGWKCEDVQHTSDALGGIDVLALTNLDGTVSPAAVLDLGIPVGRLEDRTATPVAWAEMLCARMPR